MKNCFKGLLAGFLIAVVCNMHLVIENKIVGAFLFAVGLYLIVTLGYNLFTGKVSMLASTGEGKFFRTAVWLFEILCWNLVGAGVAGWIMAEANPELIVAAENLIGSKMSQSFLQIFYRGFMCGVCIYYAVKARKALVPLIAVFIICGYEHCIADYAYMGMAGSLEFLPYLFWIIIGNSIGAIIPAAMDNYLEEQNGKRNQMC